MGKLRVLMLKETCWVSKLTVLRKVREMGTPRVSLLKVTQKVARLRGLLMVLAKVER